MPDRSFDVAKHAELSAARRAINIDDLGDVTMVPYGWHEDVLTHLGRAQ